eukprot:TRINITY_DN14089_c0_g1_i3.p1 TRINITY_DN14089_c0_g1~~TRINITY_DN14089_c0_g1_i3.p1  ORF type:complete len:188 (+),score=61.51 TRINITY_DN14089_c0_g1_i3:73-564(+)
MCIRDRGILNLVDLVGTTKFEERMEFFKNRLPLGGIKLPFNLMVDEDIYRDHCFVFHVINEETTMKLEEIKTFFVEKFGHINLYSIYGDKLEYFVIFQKHEDGKKIKELTDKSSGTHKFYLTKEGQRSVLVVRNFETYEKSIKSKALLEYEKPTMPEIYDIVA